MEWIKISEAAVRCKRPARTIRHKALLGQIRARKEGKDWYVDLNSLREHGWLTDQIDLPNNQQTKIVESPANAEDQRNESPRKTINSRVKGDVNKFRNVESLGVYSELLAFCRSDVFKSLNVEKIKDSMEGALIHLGIGYFEFDNKNKLVSYRSARHSLVHCLVQVHLRQADEIAALAATREVIDKVLPGVSGLIRRTEKRMYERRSRSESAVQD
ncbi:MAG: hypothetical protein HC883_04705 [Bdellovibrionaceae bacterium]|nr:hypothetical protein [Pseudobdellovibrionaceae bacterium]